MRPSARKGSGAFLHLPLYFYKASFNRACALEFCLFDEQGLLVLNLRTNIACPSKMKLVGDQASLLSNFDHQLTLLIKKAAFFLTNLRRHKLMVNFAAL